MCFVSIFCLLLFIYLFIFCYRCTAHFDIYKVHTPTNALFITVDKDLNFKTSSSLIKGAFVGV